MIKKLKNKIVDLSHNRNIKYILATILIILWIYIISTRSIPNPDVIALTFVLLAIITNRGKQFLKDWWFIFLVFYIYEVIRGHASWIHNLLHIETNFTLLLDWEQLIFGENIPTLVFQQFTRAETSLLDVFAVIIYLSFFFITILVGFLLWFKKRELFLEFRVAFLVLTFAALITYILFPAAPPWMASEAGLLPPLIRNSWESLKIGEWATLIFQTAGYNPVAPMPSLHTGWSLLASYYFATLFKNKFGIWANLSYLYLVSMAFVIIYTGDHYVVDILAGILYAVFAIYVAKIRLKLPLLKYLK